ncbi:MAG: hypothetical protein A2X36_10890 [Elusimicrobia bacterium GWA2_69_24]|jgi:hypothetical protein|nr:MAG: hypothetical protein A2X36_10890 [Elusimicrobia bacterium GWA2_69_24]HBL18361.1 hypothetical protein [Elusimicrobiota bacterium]
MMQEEAPLAVHYPKAEEVIAAKEYTFRIMTRLPGPVEISLDKGPWLPCRPAIGYWWYDWMCDGEGEHVIVARVFGEDNEIAVTEPRTFIVERGRGK